MVRQKSSVNAGSKAVPACCSICSGASLTGETATVCSRMPMVTTFSLGQEDRYSLWLGQRQRGAALTIVNFDFTTGVQSSTPTPITMSTA